MRLLLRWVQIWIWLWLFWTHQGELVPYRPASLSHCVYFESAWRRNFLQLSPSTCHCRLVNFPNTLLDACQHCFLLHLAFHVFLGPHHVVVFYCCFCELYIFTNFLFLLVYVVVFLLNFLHKLCSVHAILLRLHIERLSRHTQSLTHFS